jgi:hypothetical protein
MARVNDELRERVIRLTKKYNEMLCTSCPVPEYEIVDHIKSSWLGQAEWHPSKPLRTVIRFQRRITSDPVSFERIFAHEWIHHVNYMDRTPQDIAYLRAGIRTDGHGKHFLEKAALVNDVMGKDFVTIISDQNIVVAPSGKTIQLMIVKTGSKEPFRFGWAWAVRPSFQTKNWITRRLAVGNAKLVKVQDDTWTKGPKLDGSGRYAIAQDGKYQDMLRKLYEDAPEVSTDDSLRALGIDPAMLDAVRAKIRPPTV